MKSQDDIIFYCKGTRAREQIIPKHSHNCYELVYYLQGNGTIEISGTVHNFSSHTYSFTKPLSWQIESHKENAEVLYIGFYSKEKIDIEEGVYCDDNYFTMRKLLQEIYCECSQQKTDYKRMVALKIQELAILLKRTMDKLPNKIYSFEYAINFIRENYSTKIDFQNLASDCGYSYDYFRHQFQKITGYSPQQFLMNIRLETAKKLLQTSSMNCTEITYMCGFSNCAQFSTMFKKEFGISPKACQLRSPENSDNFDT